MTKEEFLARYPLPWKFKQTDPDGGGVLLDSSGQLMMRWAPDVDWREYWDANPEGDLDTKRRPVMNGGDSDTEDDDPKWSEAERECLIAFVVDRINGA